MKKHCKENKKRKKVVRHYKVLWVQKVQKIPAASSMHAKRVFRVKTVISEFQAFLELFLLTNLVGRIFWVVFRVYRYEPTP
ncbi:hypothetical protein AUJ14_04550 [Candidatus Micrarchaeota archaeon CG1_02_55_22]|nr:MAG: hypothetical protein AUJ14_04550 [Candidatus Micrarchaeota archaeon CG1_02_55_22]